MPHPVGNLIDLAVEDDHLAIEILQMCRGQSRRAPGGLKRKLNLNGRPQPEQLKLKSGKARSSTEPGYDGITISRRIRLWS